MPISTRFEADSMTPASPSQHGRGEIVGVSRHGHPVALILPLKLVVG